jgi:hypothetical protein
VATVAVVLGCALGKAKERERTTGREERRMRESDDIWDLIPSRRNGSSEHLLAGIDDGHSATELLRSAGGR